MRTVVRGLSVLALVAASTGTTAQEFSRYLLCKGQVALGGQPEAAYADFALRMNNRTALIQRSNVMPVGERLNYVPTPALYSMTYRLRPQGTQVLVVPGWLSNTILIKDPDLRRLNEIRLSINRQNGALEGIVLNEVGEVLTSFTMQCTSQTEEEIAPPKF